MEQDKPEVQKILLGLQEVISKLDGLVPLANTCIEEYSTALFTDKKELINKLDDMLLMTTHEMASHVAFLKNNIEILAQYINFRNQYSCINESELEQIIENENLSINFKLEINKKLKKIKIGDVKKDWNKTFQNQSFNKICKCFK